MFSILILTLNEEINLPACLASVAWCDDVVVLDSFSTDQTMVLAKQAGVYVVQRKFDDFASQRNYALDTIAFKHPWIFHLDADERFTDKLRVECEHVVREDSQSGFMVPSKLMFMERWLRRAGMYPTYQMRLLKRGEVRFIQHGHGQREAEAKRGIGRLREPYLHFNFSKGLTDWFEKHNRYAQAEARQALVATAAACPTVADLFATDGTRRRRALKHFSARLPFRPTVKFLYMYLFRLGFLDGIPGYHYCRLMALYEYLIVVKTAELRRQSEQSRK